MKKPDSSRQCLHGKGTIAMTLFCILILTCYMEYMQSEYRKLFMVTSDLLCACFSICVCLVCVCK